MFAYVLRGPSFPTSEPQPDEKKEKDLPHGLWRYLDIVTDFFLSLSLKALGPLLVVAAVCLIAFVIYEFFTVVFPIYFPRFNLLAACHLVLDITLIVNILYNYVQCVRTSPGYAPLNVPEDVVESGNWGPHVRFCQFCKSVKPERAHHCSACNRCVLKMDHHCPWINNCVGYFNHRYFVLFLIWLGSGCAYVALMTMPLTTQNFGVRQKLNEYQMALVQNHRAVLMFCFVLTVALAGALLGYACWHMYLIVTNQTTIEFYLNRRARRSGRPRLVYDFGYRENFEAFFEVKRHAHQWWWFFLCPATRPLGDGISYRSRLISAAPDVDTSAARSAGASSDGTPAAVAPSAAPAAATAAVTGTAADRDSEVRPVDGPHAEAAGGAPSGLRTESVPV